MATQSIQNFYPDFVPNQVLTNTQLNQLRSYLDEQNRMSRYRLIGRGIVCGLYPKRETAQKHISLSGGFGLSSDGFVLELPDTTFSHYLDPYLDPATEVDENGDLIPSYAPWQIQGNPSGQIPLIELISDEREAAANEEEKSSFLPLPNVDSWLEGKVMVLYVEIQAEDLKSCLVTDCNNKGANQRLEIRALLVNKEHLDAIQACESLDARVVKRLYASVEGGLPAIESAEDIHAGYTEAIEALRPPDLIIAIEEDFVRKTQILDLPESGIKDIRERLEALFPDKTNAVYTQYHYDFLKDILYAFHEFMSFSCKIIAPCCPESNFPRHLMLKGFGAADTDEQGGASYRHDFEPSPVRNVMHHDLQKAQKLFLRIWAMVTAFNPAVAMAAEKEITEVRITPSHTEIHELGRRAIPFYYDFSPEIANYWQPELCCSLEDLLAYHRSPLRKRAPKHIRSALSFNLLNKSFLRIEGHVGMRADKAGKEIEEWRHGHNLEFTHRHLYLFDTKEEEDKFQEGMKTRLQDIETEHHSWRKNLAEVLANPANWQNTKTTDLFAQLKKVSDTHTQSIRSLKEEVFNLNQDWRALRCQRELHCGVDHLQADYLLIRSDLLCQYHKLFRHVSALPSLIYDQALDPVEQRTDTTLRRMNDLRRARTKSSDPIAGGSSAGTAFNLDQNLRVEALMAELPEMLIAAEPLIGRSLNFDSGLKNKFTKGPTASTSNSLLNDLQLAQGEQGTEPMYSLAFFGVSLYMGIFGLRDNLHELIHYHLPKDLKKFNYPLFIQKYKDVNRNLHELMAFLALIGILLFVYLFLLVRNKEFKGNLLGTFSLVLLLLQMILDWIGSTTRLINHCRRTEFAAIYQLYEYTRAEDLSLFDNFASKMPGLEHMAGVVPGGSFFTVVDKVGTGRRQREEVIADFSLIGKASCCCEVKPEDICLPPVALFNYTSVFVDREGKKPTEKIIKVVENDFDPNPSLSSYDHAFKPDLVLSVPAKTEFGGELSLDKDNQIKLVYPVGIKELPMWGIDSFAYEIKNECGESDSGRVFIIVVSNLADAAEPRGEVSGFVREVTGAPVTGATVQVDNAPNTLPQVTLKDGSYRISNLEAGTYSLTASRRGFTSQSKSVTITSGTDENLDFILERDTQTQFGTINGKVIDAKDGSSLPGASVILKGTTQGAITDFDGNYSLNNAPVGTQELQASVTGYDSLLKSVNVVAGKAVELDFAMGNDFIRIVIPAVITLPGTGTIGTGGGSVTIPPAGGGLGFAPRGLEEAQSPRNEVYTARMNAYLKTAGSLAVLNVSPSHTASKQAMEWLTLAAAGSPLSELEDRLDSALNVLGKAYGTARKKDQKVWRQWIHSLMHCYLDRLVWDAGETLDAASGRKLKKRAAKLAKAELSLTGIRNRWQGKEWAKVASPEVINSLQKILST